MLLLYLPNRNQGLGCAVQLSAPQTSEVGSLTELTYWEGKKRLQVQVCLSQAAGSC